MTGPKLRGLHGKAGERVDGRDFSMFTGSEERPAKKEKLKTLERKRDVE